MLVQAVVAIAFFGLGQSLLGIFNAAGFVITLVCFIFLIRGRPAVGFVAMHVQNIAGTILMTVYAGLGTGFFLFALVGLVYGTLAEWVSRPVWRMIIVASGATFVGLLLYGLYAPPLAPLPTAWTMAFAALNGTTTVAMLAVVAITYRDTVDRAEAALGEEYEKSEMLLHNILPPVVAARLKDDPAVIADSHDAVTILFADIVGFTEMFSDASPEALVSLLNTVFSRFDDLVEAEQLEKIKTIGDAYMAVAGLPAARPDHAQAAARLALAMVAAADDVSRNTGVALQIRVGIHSGPVVAGVIGQRKFAYDLWGDTVNVAARMESHGEAGRIQVSADTARLLGDAFILEPRGEIDVKGKGAMPVFFLTGAKAGAKTGAKTAIHGENAADANAGS